MKAGIKKQEVEFIVTDEYREWIALIKDKIKNSQIKASIKVNRELLELYWNIGSDIVNRQKHSKWGEGLLRQMSIDLKKTFPDMSGFSETNLKTMRLWYCFYAEVVNGQQVVDEFRYDDIFRLITTIPWGHNQRIIFKCKDIREAIFYAQYTLENNWSRNVLEHQIESRLYERKGKAITNFKDKLPANASDLAIQTLKDPYSFDFLAMRDDYDEKELEDALVNQITQFLLELGIGFSYIGRQVHLQVGEREFYVTAVNKQLTGEGDNPAIGLLICKDKDNVVAEYSLEEVSQPIGIAEYELSNALSKEYQRSLPTIEILESEVAKMTDTK